MHDPKKFLLEWLRLALFWGTVFFASTLGLALALKTYVELAKWTSIFTLR